MSNHVESYSLAWNNGRVIFNTGDTIACKVRFNETIAKGVLQIMENESIVTVTADDVGSFSFYDAQGDKLRKFSTMSLLKDDSQQKVFLERLYDDQQFSILKHKTLDVPYEYMNYTRLISKPVLMSKRYILNVSTGELLPLSKENALRLLAHRKTEITSFIQEHHIRFKRVADYINVFQYHNSL
jgi:hypothetical protein